MKQGGTWVRCCLWTVSIPSCLQWLCSMLETKIPTWWLVAFWGLFSWIGQLYSPDFKKLCFGPLLCIEQFQSQSHSLIITLNFSSVSSLQKCITNFLIWLWLCNVLIFNNICYQYMTGTERMPLVWFSWVIVIRYSYLFFWGGDAFYI